MARSCPTTRRRAVVDRRPDRGAGPADGAVDHPVPAGEPAVTDLGGGPGRGRPCPARTHHHRPGRLAVGPGGVAAGAPAAADGRAETRPLGHLHPDTAIPAPRRRRPRLAQHREPTTRRAAPAGHRPVTGTRAAWPPGTPVAGRPPGADRWRHPAGGPVPHRTGPLSLIHISEPTRP